MSQLLNQKGQIWLLALMLKGPVFNQSDLYSKVVFTILSTTKNLSHTRSLIAMFLVESLHLLFHSNPIRSFVLVILF